MAPHLAFPARRVVLPVLPAFAFVGALAAWAAVLAATDGETAVVFPEAAAALGAVAGAAVTIRVALARVVLTRWAVTAPRILGRRIIPITEVAGVGPHYASAGQGSGWRCPVWPVHGPRVALSVPPPSHDAPKNLRHRWRVRPGVAPRLDWDYVARSPAGRAALAVAERANAVQGPRGQYATQHRETLSTASGTETAYWSPTGTCGVLAGARPAGPHDSELEGETASACTNNCAG